MVTPSKIYTLSGDCFKVLSYEDGAFILEENPFFFSYHVDSCCFTISKNGILFPSGVKAKNAAALEAWKMGYEAEKTRYL